jgi:nickel transport protein
MHRVRSVWRRQAALALLLWLVAAIAMPSPVEALDLFGTAHEVTVTLEAQDGKPMADAEVRVFAPGQPNRPTTSGRTDSGGKFTFTADRDGFWSAEAKRGDEIARVSIKVGGKETTTEQISPFLLLGLLLLMLGFVIWYRMLRARAARRGG